jgi:hypothetical protein
MGGEPEDCCGAAASCPEDHSSWQDSRTINALPRGALSPTMVYGLSDGWRQCFAPQTKGKAKNGLIGPDRPTTNNLVAPVIITIVPVPHDPGDGTSSHGSNVTSLPTSTNSLKSISNHAKAHSNYETN